MAAPLGGTRPIVHLTHAHGDYWLCGWRVRSDIVLPGISAWSGDNRAPDVTVQSASRAEGSPPPPQPFHLLPNDVWQFAAKDTVFDIDADGRHVLVTTDTPQATDVVLLLLGAVVPAVALKRGWLPLHASAVRIDGRAVAFLGPSGAGKSTVAAAFMRAGYGVAADDLAMVDGTASEGPWLWPSVPFFKLCPDAVSHLQLVATGEAPNLKRKRKLLVPANDAFVMAPLPLRAIFHLRWDSANPSSISGLHGARAVSAVLDVVNHWRLAHRFVGAADIATRVARVCSGVPRHAVISRSPSDSVEALVASVRTALGA